MIITILFCLILQHHLLYELSQSDDGMKHTFDVSNTVFVLIIPAQDQAHLLLPKEVFHLMKKMKIFSLPWTHQSGRFVLIYKKQKEANKS